MTTTDDQPRYLSRERIQTVFDASIPELVMVQGRFDGFIFTKEIGYACNASPETLSFDGGIVQWKKTDKWGTVQVIFRFETGLLRIILGSETLSADAYAISDDAADALLDLTREHIPPMELAEDIVPVTFWRHVPKIGALPNTRKIEAPFWDDIKDNYVDSTRCALDQLIGRSLDSKLAGKLVLWHGEPGTGKTYALRSWARSCRDQIDVNYIVDPEVFFGNSSYMMELLARRSSRELSLFIAEDTGELLASDAKRSIGQGLSRLLNICDGFIGQGMRILFLITTNEELGSMHPAVVRPGRCYANIGFERFTENEAAHWLSTRGVEGERIPSKSTIAELYSFIDREQILAEKQKVFGFVA
ncbi:MAG: DUF5925 domain-containing protein [Thermoleophilia bacterium]